MARPFCVWMEEIEGVALREEGVIESPCLQCPQVPISSSPMDARNSARAGCTSLGPWVGMFFLRPIPFRSETGIDFVECRTTRSMEDRPKVHPKTERG